jgi:hypothetical protein
MRCNTPTTSDDVLRGDGRQRCDRGRGIVSALLHASAEPKPSQLSQLVLLGQRSAAPVSGVQGSAAASASGPAWVLLRLCFAASRTNGGRRSRWCGASCCSTADRRRSRTGGPAAALRDRQTRRGPAGELHCCAAAAALRCRVPRQSAGEPPAPAPGPPRGTSLDIRRRVVALAKRSPRHLVDVSSPLLRLAAADQRPRRCVGRGEPPARPLKHPEAPERCTLADSPFAHRAFLVARPLSLSRRNMAGCWCAGCCAPEPARRLRSAAAAPELLWRTPRASRCSKRRLRRMQTRRCCDLGTEASTRWCWCCACSRTLALLGAEAGTQILCGSKSKRGALNRTSAAAGSAASLGSCAP